MAKMMRNSIDRQLLVPVLGILLAAILNCGGTEAPREVAAEFLEDRQGEPELFTIDGVSYDADRFREEILYDRLVHENRVDVPTPEEMESELNRYIVETLVLEKALGEISGNDSEFKRYMWRYIREGMMQYYLDKRTGRLDAYQAYRSAAESSAVTEEELKAMPELRKLHKEDPELAARMLAAAALRRRLEAAKRLESVEIGKIRSGAKVKIKGGALYARPVN